MDRVVCLVHHLPYWSPERLNSEAQAVDCGADRAERRCQHGGSPMAMTVGARMTAITGRAMRLWAVSRPCALPDRETAIVTHAATARAMLGRDIMVPPRYAA